MTSASYAYDDLMNPVIRALKMLGGSGINEEINDLGVSVRRVEIEQISMDHDWFSRL